MAPRKQKQPGIISCDPSFKGMAWAMYLPALATQEAKCYDIREERKIYDTAEMIRDLVYRHLIKMIEDFKLVHECSMFVIEGQFKRKMIRLQETVCSQMRVLFPDMKILVIPAYSTRKFFGTNTSSYYQNKKESINFLKANPQLLVGELWSNNDNICEAIILLNHLAQKKSLEFDKSIPFEAMAPITPIDCTDCKVACVAAISNSEKNPNRAYWKCDNRDCKKWQEKKSFICWQGEEASVGKWQKPGTKRAVETNPNVTIVPVAKRTEPPQIPTVSSSRSAPPQNELYKPFVDMMSKIMSDCHKRTEARMAAFAEKVDLVLERTKKLDYLEFSVQEEQSPIDFYCAEQSLDIQSQVAYPVEYANE